MNIVIACDFHSRMQQLVEYDSGTQQRRWVRLEHADREAVAAYYRAQPAGAVVLLETTAYTHWFSELLAELGLELIYGDAGRLAAMRPRKVKTDRRDAENMLDAYLRDQFPRVMMPGPEQRDLRQLLLHRDRLVRTRTRFRNGLHLLAMSRGVNRKSALFGPAGRQALLELRLSRWEAEARSDLLLALDALDLRIAELDQAVEEAVRADALALRLRTHPGVGPVTALAWSQIMGDCQRFKTSGHAASYLGLTPCEASSADHRRLGSITKQGNRFMRWLLVEAAQSAARHEEGMRRRYRRLAARKNRPIAKLAVARRLAERMYWMSRRGVGYPEVLAR